MRDTECDERRGVEGSQGQHNAIVTRVSDPMSAALNAQRSSSALRKGGGGLLLELLLPRQVGTAAVTLPVANQGASHQQRTVDEASSAKDSKEKRLETKKPFETSAHRMLRTSQSLQGERQHEHVGDISHIYLERHQTQPDINAGDDSFAIALRGNNGTDEEASLSSSDDEVDENGGDAKKAIRTAHSATPEDSLLKRFSLIGDTLLQTASAFGLLSQRFHGDEDAYSRPFLVDSAARGGGGLDSNSNGTSSAGGGVSGLRKGVYRPEDGYGLTENTYASALLAAAAAAVRSDKSQQQSGGGGGDATKHLSSASSSLLEAQRVTREQQRQIAQLLTPTVAGGAVDGSGGKKNRSDAVNNAAVSIGYALSAVALLEATAVSFADHPTFGPLFSALYTAISRGMLSAALPLTSDAAMAAATTRTIGTAAPSFSDLRKVPTPAEEEAFMRRFEFGAKRSGAKASTVTVSSSSASSSSLGLLTSIQSWVLKRRDAYVKETRPFAVIANKALAEDGDDRMKETAQAVIHSRRQKRSLKQHFVAWRRVCFRLRRARGRAEYNYKAFHCKMTLVKCFGEWRRVATEGRYNALFSEQTEIRFNLQIETKTKNALATDLQLATLKIQSLEAERKGLISELTTARATIADYQSPMVFDFRRPIHDQNNKPISGGCLHFSLQSRYRFNTASPNALWMADFGSIVPPEGVTLPGRELQASHYVIRVLPSAPTTTTLGSGGGEGNASGSSAASSPLSAHVDDSVQWANQRVQLFCRQRCGASFADAPLTSKGKTMKTGEEDGGAASGEEGEGRRQQHQGPLLSASPSMSMEPEIIRHYKFFMSKRLALLKQRTMIAEKFKTSRVENNVCLVEADEEPSYFITEACELLKPKQVIGGGVKGGGDEKNSAAGDAPTTTKPNTPASPSSSSSSSAPPITLAARLSQYALLLPPYARDGFLKEMAANHAAIAQRHRLQQQYHASLQHQRTQQARQQQRAGGAGLAIGIGFNKKADVGDEPSSPTSPSRRRQKSQQGQEEEQKDFDAAEEAYFREAEAAAKLQIVLSDPSLLLAVSLYNALCRVGAMAGISFGDFIGSLDWDGLNIADDVGSSDEEDEGAGAHTTEGYEGDGTDAKIKRRSNFISIGAGSGRVATAAIWSFVEASNVIIDQSPQHNNGLSSSHHLHHHHTPIREVHSLILARLRALYTMGHCADEVAAYRLKTATLAEKRRLKRREEEETAAERVEMASTTAVSAVGAAVTTLTEGSAARGGLVKGKARSNENAINSTLAKNNVLIYGNAIHTASSVPAFSQLYSSLLPPFFARPLKGLGPHGTARHRTEHTLYSLVGHQYGCNLNTTNASSPSNTNTTAAATTMDSPTLEIVKSSGGAYHSTDGEHLYLLAWVKHILLASGYTSMSPFMLATVSSNAPKPQPQKEEDRTKHKSNTLSSSVAVSTQASNTSDVNTSAISVSSTGTDSSKTTTTPATKKTEAGNSQNKTAASSPSVKVAATSSSTTAPFSSPNRLLNLTNFEDDFGDGFAMLAVIVQSMRPVDARGNVIEMVDVMMRECREEYGGDYDEDGENAIAVDALQIESDEDGNSDDGDDATSRHVSSPTLALIKRAQRAKQRSSHLQGLQQHASAMVAVSNNATLSNTQRNGLRSVEETLRLIARLLCDVATNELFCYIPPDVEAMLPHCSALSRRLFVQCLYNRAAVVANALITRAMGASAAMMMSQPSSTVGAVVPTGMKRGSSVSSCTTLFTPTLTTTATAPGAAGDGGSNNMLMGTATTTTTAHLISAIATPAYAYEGFVPLLLRECRTQPCGSASGGRSGGGTAIAERYRLSLHARASNSINSSGGSGGVDAGTINSISRLNLQAGGVVGTSSSLSLSHGALSFGEGGPLSGTTATRSSSPPLAVPHPASSPFTGANTINKRSVGAQMLSQFVFASPNIFGRRGAAAMHLKAGGGGAASVGGGPLSLANSPPSGGQASSSLSSSASPMLKPFSLPYNVESSRISGFLGDPYSELPLYKSSILEPLSSTFFAIFAGISTTVMPPLPNTEVFRPPSANRYNVVSSDAPCGLLWDVQCLLRMDRALFPQFYAAADGGMVDGPTNASTTTPPLSAGLPSFSSPSSPAYFAPNASTTTTLPPPTTTATPPLLLPSPLQLLREVQIMRAFRDVTASRGGASISPKDCHRLSLKVLETHRDHVAYMCGGGYAALAQLHYQQQQEAIKQQQLNSNNNGANEFSSLNFNNAAAAASFMNRRPSSASSSRNDPQQQQGTMNGGAMAATSVFSPSALRRMDSNASSYFCGGNNGGRGCDDGNSNMSASMSPSPQFLSAPLASSGMGGGGGARSNRNLSVVQLANKAGFASILGGGQKQGRGFNQSSSNNRRASLSPTSVNRGGDNNNDNVARRRGTRVGMVGGGDATSNTSPTPLTKAAIRMNRFAVAIDDSEANTSAHLTAATHPLSSVSTPAAAVGGAFSLGASGILLTPDAIIVDDDSDSASAAHTNTTAGGGGNNTRGVGGAGSGMTPTTSPSSSPPPTVLLLLHRSLRESTESLRIGFSQWPELLVRYSVYTMGLMSASSNRSVYSSPSASGEAAGAGGGGGGGGGVANNSSAPPPPPPLPLTHSYSEAHAFYQAVAQQQQSSREKNASAGGVAGVAADDYSSSSSPTRRQKRPSSANNGQLTPSPYHIAPQALDVWKKGNFALIQSCARIVARGAALVVVTGDKGLWLPFVAQDMAASAAGRTALEDALLLLSSPPSLVSADPSSSSDGLHSNYCFPVAGSLLPPISAPSTSSQAASDALPLLDLALTWDDAFATTIPASGVPMKAMVSASVTTTRTATATVGGVAVGTASTNASRRVSSNKQQSLATAPSSLPLSPATATTRPIAAMTVTFLNSPSPNNTAGKRGELTRPSLTITSPPDASNTLASNPSSLPMATTTSLSVQVPIPTYTAVAASTVDTTVRGSTAAALFAIYSSWWSDLWQQLDKRVMTVHTFAQMCVEMRLCAERSIEEIITANNGNSCGGGVGTVTTVNSSGSGSGVGGGGARASSAGRRRSVSHAGRRLTVALMEGSGGGVGGGGLLAGPSSPLSMGGPRAAPPPSAMLHWQHQSRQQALLQQSSQCYFPLLASPSLASASLCASLSVIAPLPFKVLLNTFFVVAACQRCTASQLWIGNGNGGELRRLAGGDGEGDEANVAGGDGGKRKKSAMSGAFNRKRSQSTGPTSSAPPLGAFENTDSLMTPLGSDTGVNSASASQNPIIVESFLPPPPPTSHLSSSPPPTHGGLRRGPHSHQHPNTSSSQNDASPSFAVQAVVSTVSEHRTALVVEEALERYKGYCAGERLGIAAGSVGGGGGGEEADEGGEAASSPNRNANNGDGTSPSKRRRRQSTSSASSPFSSSSSSASFEALSTLRYNGYRQLIVYLAATLVPMPAIPLPMKLDLLMRHVKRHFDAIVQFQDELAAAEEN